MRAETAGAGDSPRYIRGLTISVDWARAEREKREEEYGESDFLREKDASGEADFDRIFAQFGVTMANVKEATRDVARIRKKKLALICANLLWFGGHSELSPAILAFDRAVIIEQTRRNEERSLSARMPVAASVIGMREPFLADGSSLHERFREIEEEQAREDAKIAAEIQARENVEKIYAEQRTRESVETFIELSDF